MGVRPENCTHPDADSICMRFIIRLYTPGEQVPLCDVKQVWDLPKLSSVDASTPCRLDQRSNYKMAAKS